ncbi:MAG: Spy/CpxP family protein refolding chaperone [Candidatus Neomarinimicrobiota bacterium]
MIKKLLPFLLVSGTMVFAQSWYGPGMCRLLWNEDLKLTKEQQEQITKLGTQFQTQVIDLRADLQKLRLELQEQLRAVSPNKKAIDATLDKINAKQGAIQKLRVNHQLDVRAVLTPEQREIFDSRPFKRGFGKGRLGRDHRGGWFR